jgi:hypothetical protein
MSDFLFLLAIGGFGCIVVVSLFRLKLREKDMSQSRFGSENP